MAFTYLWERWVFIFIFFFGLLLAFACYTVFYFAILGDLMAVRKADGSWITNAIIFRPEFSGRVEQNIVRRARHREKRGSEKEKRK